MNRLIGALLLVFSVGLTPVFADALFDSEAAQAHLNTGLNLYYKNQYKNAIEEFEEAARIDPENAQTYYYMGYAYYKLKDMKKAMEVFDLAYEVDAKYSPLRDIPAAENPQGESE